MKEDLNIEELFKASFENFEAPVDPSVWANVQSNIAAKTATTAGKGILAAKGLKTAALIITTLGAGLGLGYIFFNDKEEPTVQQEITKQETAVTTDNSVTPEILSENEALPLENTTLESPKEKTSAPKEKVKVIVKEESQMRYRSIVQQWLTPSNRKNNNSTAYLEKLIDEALPAIENNEGTNAKNDQPEVKVETIDESKPVADIIASFTAGTAPLVVDFENIATADEYHWDFGDGTTSTRVTPQHVYNEPGNYTVTLTVKDKKGNTTSATKLIEVLVGATIEKHPNVFTPNNDNENDIFFLKGENIAYFELTVYSKNQSIVFQSNDINKGWNGEDRFGRQLPEGNYYYVYRAIGTDGKVLSGKNQLLLTR